MTSIPANFAAVVLVIVFCCCRIWCFLVYFFLITNWEDVLELNQVGGTKFLCIRSTACNVFWSEIGQTAGMEWSDHWPWWSVGKYPRSWIYQGFSYLLTRSKVSDIDNAKFQWISGKVSYLKCGNQIDQAITFEKQTERIQKQLRNMKQLRQQCWLWRHK